MRLRVIADAVREEAVALDGLFSILAAGKATLAGKLAAECLVSLRPYLPVEARKELARRTRQRVAKAS